MGKHYYATLGHADADVLPLVQQFDNLQRRNQWVSHSQLAGSDIEVRPVTARQADSLTRRLVHRLDRYLLQAPEYEPLSDMKDEYYLRRNPFCHHDGNYDAPLSTVNGSYRPYTCNGGRATRGSMKSGTGGYHWLLLRIGCLRRSLETI